jgi:delta 1-pyrroline-5-carboxylate dehydrogenase
MAPAMNDQPLHLLNAVGGSYQEAIGCRRMDVTSPVDAALIATVTESSAADVHLAVEAAASAFDSRSRSTPRERQRVLLRLADGLEAEADELAELRGFGTRTHSQPTGYASPRRAATRARNKRRRGR